MSSREKAKGLLPIALGMLAGAGVGFVVGWLSRHNALGFRLHGDAVLALLPALFLVVTLHEVGHALLGLAMGFEFHSLISGPFCWIRKDGAVTFRFNGNPALWGPRAGCLPRSFGPDLRTKMLWFTAGGPLFSLLAALALVPAYLLRGSDPHLAGYLLVTGLPSLLILMMTLIPMNAGGSTSDGARMLMLLRNRPEGMRWVAMGALAGMSTNVRPRDWPEGLVELLGDGSDTRPDAAVACLLRHYWYVDRREWDAAARWMERGLAKVECLARSLRSVVYFSAARLEAQYRHDGARAREYFDEASKVGYSKAADFPTIAAAVLIAEGRREEAAAQLELAEKSLSAKPPGQAACLRDDIAELREALA